MIRAAEGGLAPVYAPLAEEMVERLSLADKDGVGIDLGSGPGTLIIELCKRTKLHWINADINPHFFPYFFRRAEAAGYGGRVSAIRADACSLPFRDDFAEVIVSRGSLQFWPDLREGLAEVQRVLKPGGVAYIGRGPARKGCRWKSHDNSAPALARARNTIRMKPSSSFATRWSRWASRTSASTGPGGTIRRASTTASGLSFARSRTDTGTRPVVEFACHGARVRVE